MSDFAFSRRRVLELLGGGLAMAVGGVPARAAYPRMTRLIEQAAALPTIAQRIDFISQKLLATPYRSYTLIGGPRKPEQFVTRDDAFDCVTFCEAVLAAARAHKPEEYEPVLRRIRYDEGRVSWRDRNHYFAQWIENNIANHVCRALAVPGSETTVKTISYMPALGSRRVSMTYVPRASLQAHRQMLATGDVIGFVSQRPRVDYYHTGFIVVAANGDLRLRHAAESRGRVLDEPLLRFLAVNRVKAVTLLRPREPEDSVARI